MTGVALRPAPPAVNSKYSNLHFVFFSASRLLQMVGRTQCVTTSRWTNASRRWRTKMGTPLVRAVCGPWTQPRWERCRRSCTSGGARTPSLFAGAWPGQVRTFEGLCLTFRSRFYVFNMSCSAQGHLLMKAGWKNWRMSGYVFTTSVVVDDNFLSKLSNNN